MTHSASLALPVNAHIVLMGVAGSGKTTTAVELAHALREQSGQVIAEAEADDFHSPENVAKMAAGIPLTDEDRWPWLAALHQWLQAQSAAGARAVITCSALRRVYRDVLAANELPVIFVHLDAPYEVLRDRMSNRPGHYMPVSLLDSQLATLEPLDDDEHGFRIDVTADLPNVLAHILSHLP